MTKPLIVTAELARPDFAWLDDLRRRHYPPERNRLPAHCTIFHGLPPSAEPELRQALARQSASPPPNARLAGVMDLGGGVAFRIVSPDLDRIRGELGRELHGLLSAQDEGGWIPHVTVQNKVEPSTARTIRRSLEKDFTPRPIGITGLGLHRYLGGPWETLRVYSFRGR